MQQTGLYYPCIADITWTEGNQYQNGNTWTKVVISGEDYKVCSEIEMWSSSKKGNYGKGLKNTAEDPKRVERSGKLGEMAFARLCGLGVDLSYRKLGDDMDFSIMGIKIDVKTSLRNQGFGLIYAQAPGGRKLDLKCDRFVFAYIADDNREEEEATVVVVGYVKKLALENRPLVPGWRGGGHMNYLLYYSECEPISKILSATRKEIATL